MRSHFSSGLSARLATAALVAVSACGTVPAAFAAAPTAPPPQPDGGARNWHFTVLLDGRPIGSHDFSVSRAVDDVQVRSHASFRVTALFLPLYQYEHEDLEDWRSSCLARIQAHTRDNGRESVVQGEPTRGGFEVRGPQGALVLPGCVMSFAYWDTRILCAHRLLNAQTGAYEPVEITSLGSATVRVRDQAVAADHYALATGKFRIELWYSRAGEWLALQSRSDQGRTLRYEIR